METTKKDYDGSKRQKNGEWTKNPAREKAKENNDKFFLRFCKKCNEEIEQAYPEAWGAEVNVKLKNGKEFSVRRKHAKGDPDAPLSPSEMLEKAVMLFRFGGVQDPENWVERILKLPREPSFRDSDLHQLLDISGNGQWVMTKS